MSNVSPRYGWAGRGDVNAFFGLMLDNIADLVLLVALLAGAFDFDATFALRCMIPGTAVGVLVGDLLFTLMAIRLAGRTGRTDITAMPLGVDTPSTFGLVLFVIGPVYQGLRSGGVEVEAACRMAWYVGIWAIVFSAAFKFVCALGSAWVRKLMPRAGLLGSLAAIALVLISFMPLLEILQFPVVGLASMAVILTALVGRLPLPGRVPGALGALVIGAVIYYAMLALGLLEPEPLGIEPRDALLPTGWLEAWRFEWVWAFNDAVRHVPVIIPFALAAVVGGIDCTESAAAAGDEFPTGQVIAVDALATLCSGLCGGVLQTTPYIGHPAYKAMGGRAAYTLATALFVGSAGLLGFFGYVYAIVPKPTIFPILVFIGLEITAQSFAATPRRHYPAVALACVPALASLVAIFAGQVMARLGMTLAKLAEIDALLGHQLQTINMLSSGFIVTSLLWAASLAALIDRRMRLAAAYFAVAALCALFGVIHSPLAGSPLALPWDLPAPLPETARFQSPYHLAAAYGVVAIIILAWSAWLRPEPAADAAAPANGE